MNVPGCKTDNSGASVSGNPFLSSPALARRRLQEMSSVTALGWSGSGRSRASSSQLPTRDVSQGASLRQALSGDGQRGPPSRADGETIWPPQAALLPLPRGADCGRPSVGPFTFLRCPPRDPTAQTWGRDHAEHSPPSDHLPELPLPAPPGGNRKRLSGQE